MLGGCDDKVETKSVLTCSLTEILQSSPSSSSIWHRVADAPAYLSTCAAVNGELLAVGGRKGMKPSSAIHKYNPTTNSWDLISNTPTARYDCHVAILPTNEIMVVGGHIGYGFTNICTEVEIATCGLR
jgi:N-acetylneuraminic acid mutarotase